MMKFAPPALLLALLSISMPTPAAGPAAAAAVPAAVPEPRVQVLPGERASFDCARARAIDELIICSDHDLALLDRRMGEIYAAARAALPKAEKDALVQAQRQWLSGHDKACAIPAQGPLPDNAAACFAKRYQARTAALQALLARGNLIREVGGNEPWVEANSSHILFACVPPDEEVDENMCCPPGTTSFSPGVTKYATFLIDGRRYIFFSGNYSLVFHAPRGAYTREVDENGEEYEVAPEVPEDNRSCTLVLVEKTPGAGDFAEAAYQANSVLGIAEFLAGGPRENGPDNKFASDLHAKFPGEITVVEKNGAAQRYTWNAATKSYVKSR